MLTPIAALRFGKHSCELSTGSTAVRQKIQAVFEIPNRGKKLMQTLWEPLFWTLVFFEAPGRTLELDISTWPKTPKMLSLREARTRNFALTLQPRPSIGPLYDPVCTPSASFRVIDQTKRRKGSVCLRLLVFLGCELPTELRTAPLRFGVRFKPTRPVDVLGVCSVTEASKHVFGEKIRVFLRLRL